MLFLQSHATSHDEPYTSVGPNNATTLTVFNVWFSVGLKHNKKQNLCTAGATGH